MGSGRVFIAIVARLVDGGSRVAVVVVVVAAVVVAVVMVVVVVRGSRLRSARPGSEVIHRLCVALQTKRTHSIWVGPGGAGGCC